MLPTLDNSTRIISIILVMCALLVILSVNVHNSALNAKLMDFILLIKNEAAISALYLKNGTDA